MKKIDKKRLFLINRYFFAIFVKFFLILLTTVEEKAQNRTIDISI